MDPERICLALRPRSDWESVDLGLRLAQAHAGLLYRGWLLASLPWAVLIGVACIWSGWPLLSFVLFWWSKPLYERVLLHLLSRLAFDDRPRRGELLRLALGLPFSAAWLRALTYGRFELSRSFNLPVWQLEGLRGTARRRRAAVLHLGAGGSGPALTLCSFASVWLLYLTLAGLVMSVQVRDIMVFDPWSLAAYIEALIDTVAAGGTVTQAVCFGLYYLCEGFIATFYVAAGFCLYLNRRTHLEAWDIELQFRRALRRRDALRGGSAAAALVSLMLAFGGQAPTASAADNSGRIVYAAADTDADQMTRDAVTARAEALIADGQFGRIETQREWRAKASDADADDDETTGELPVWLKTLATLFGSLTELILWIAVGAVLVIVFLYRAQWLPLLRGQRRRDIATRESGRRGMLMQRAEMPDDVPASARALWQDGRRAEGLSLLYRALITTLDQRHRLGVHHSDTEGDCLRRVRSGTAPDTSRYFAQVTRSWQSIAYADRAPSSEQFAALCARWYELVGSQQ